MQIRRRRDGDRRDDDDYRSDEDQTADPHGGDFENLSRVLV